jgi:hypothetical protein
MNFSQSRLALQNKSVYDIEHGYTEVHGARTNKDAGEEEEKVKEKRGEKDVKVEDRKRENRKQYKFRPLTFIVNIFRCVYFTK